MSGLDLKGPNTAFSASDLLSFYGSLLSLLGSVALGYVAIYQNKRITDLNERATLIEEENNYPYIEADVNNIITKKVNDPTWTSEFVQGKSYITTGYPIYQFTKYIKSESPGASTDKITIIISLKNTSQVVITKLAFLSLQGVMPDKGGNLVSFLHERDDNFDHLNSSAISPEKTIIIYMNFVTNNADIKRALLQLPTELYFLFEVSTLHHSYRQKIGFEFESGNLSEVRYDYDV